MEYYLRFIDDMKSEHPDMNALSGLPVELVIDAVAAWPFSDVEINDEGKKIDESMPYQQKLEMLWSNVSINNEKWVGMQKEIPPQSTMIRLILAKLVYPDGTVNVDWLNTMRERLAMEKLKGGR